MGNAEPPSAYCSGPGDIKQDWVASERLGLYAVPLGCEAAPALGCGVKAKPILQALAREPAVAQAWLNRDGTIIAVLWREGIAAAVRGERLRSILAVQGLAARELVGASRASTPREFSSNAEWYGSDAVDHLSEEEATIIAARLVRRVTARVPLPEGKIETLLAAIAEACRRQLVDRPLTSARLRRKRIANEILDAGRKHLAGTSFAALQDAVALGHRAIAGEK